MKFPIAVAGLFIALGLQAQDTFSIVAVDIATGQVGSAGATCLDDGDVAGGAVIISDVIPDIGAVHTQSYWIPANQISAHEQVTENGLSPEELMEWLQENDAENNASIRQYGMADLVSGSARSAAFTGSNCFNWKGHIVGDNYAIQGNILLGEEILTQMEAGFLETEGSLADRLMAAMQGANVPGADTRCLDEGVSSQSAFLRVAYPGDDPSDLTLDIVVSSTPFGSEPIDVLQAEFDAWNSVSKIDEASLTGPLLITRQANGRVLLKWDGPIPANLIAFNLLGEQVGAVEITNRLTSWILPTAETLLFRLSDAKGNLLTSMKYSGQSASPNTQSPDRE